MMITNYTNDPRANYAQASHDIARDIANRKHDKQVKRRRLAYSYLRASRRINDPLLSMVALCHAMRVWPGILTNDRSI